MTSIARLLSVTATLKTKGTFSADGKRSVNSGSTSISCTPLDPVDAETIRRMELKTPLEVKQTFIEGSTAVVEGDILTISGKDYPVRAVEEWTWRSTTMRRLILEDVKA